MITIYDNRKKRPYYSGDSHHAQNPKGLPFRGGGKKKTEILPSNHGELWKNAKPDVGGPLTKSGQSKNWYAKDADGSIHRVQTNHNNETHWSGSTRGESGLKVPERVKKELDKG